LLVNSDVKAAQTDNEQNNIHNNCLLTLASVDILISSEDGIKQQNEPKDAGNAK